MRDDTAFKTFMLLIFPLGIYFIVISNQLTRIERLLKEQSRKETQMSMTTKCPYCGHTETYGGEQVRFDSNGLCSTLQQCSKCQEYYTDHYKIKYIGSTSYGCNMFPADGETEETMRLSGVEMDD
jgi:ribosomal protein L32